MVLTPARPDPLVLWVVPVGELGGVARHVLDVARAGIPGYRVWFLVPEGPLAFALRDLRAPVLTGAIGPDAGVITSVRTLRRTLSRLRPALVHSHLAYADVVAAAATVGQPVSLVSTEHGIAGDDRMYHGSSLRQGVMAAVHTVRTRRFDALIAVADATAAAMRRKWRVRDVTVIHNGIDQPARAAGGVVAGSPPAAESGARPLRIASLARLAPEKRLDRLLAAFALLRRTHPEATLVVAGDGPLRPGLVAQAERLGVADQVSFPGYVPAAEVLADTDVLVQLSAWENCSYALLDALVAGVGVVATPVGGNPELVPAAALVSADDAEAVAAAILTQSDPAQRSTLRADWPSVRGMGQAIAAVYDRVLR